MELEPLILPVEADDADYHAKMDRVEKKLVAVSKKMMSIGAGMSVAITAPLSLMARNSISAFSDFDEAMTKSTSIISGMTAENRKAMEDQAKAIAGSTRTSAAKAAEAYYFLASAGLDAKQAIGALPIVEKFATAGAFDMAKATELLADSQSALGLATGTNAERMASMVRVSDVLVDSANMANASVEQFAKALTTKSAAALRGMNKDVEEGVATLAVFADAGIKGEMAGEKLAIVLRETQNAAMKQSKAWRSLGLNIYDTSGNMKNLADVVDTLESATKGMSDQQRAARFDMLGLKSESLDAIRPLMGMTDKMRAYEKRLRAAGGATEDVAGKQMKSFAAQMDILRNQMGLAAIEIGQILAPSVLHLNQNIAAGLTYWRGLSDNTKELTVNMAKLVAVTGPGLVIAGKLTGILSGLVPQMNAVAKAAKLLASGIVSMVSTFVIANPITATLLAIGAVIAGVTYLIVGPEGMASAWESTKSAVGSFVTTAIGFLKNFSANVGILYNWVVDNWRTILTDMANAYIIYNKNMIGNVGVGLKTMMRLFVAFYGWLWQTSNTFWTFIFSDAFQNAVATGIQNALQAMIGFAEKGYQIYLGFAEGAQQVFQALGQAILDTMSAIPGIVLDIVSRTGKAFKQVMTAILTGNLPDISAFMKEIAAASQEAFLKAADGAVQGIAKASIIIEDKMKAVTDQVAADFNKGMSDPNFFNTAKDILAEGMAEMVSPLEGFTAQTMAPQFITGTKDMAEAAASAGNAIAELSKDGDEAAKGLSKADEKAADLQKTMAKKMKLDLGKPVDAVAAFTGDALALWIDYQKKAKTINTAAAADAVKEKKKAATVPQFAPESLGPDVMNDPRFAGLAQKHEAQQESGTKASAVASASGQGASAVLSSAVADGTGGSITALLTKIEQNTRGGGITIKQISGN